MNAALMVAAAFLLVADHELAHWLTAKGLGYHARFSVGWLGRCYPYPMVEITDDVTARHQILIAAAGPAASVLLGLVLLPVDVDVAGFSIVLGLASLIPVRPQDGWMIRQALI